MKLKAVLISAAAVLIAAGCATVPDVEADKAALLKADLENAEAVNTGNVEGYLATWDENGTRMDPDAPQVRGKEALRKLVSARFGLADRKMVVNIEEMVPGGDWAFVRGTYTQTVTPKAGGAASLVDGKFLSIWKRQADGSWKMYIDCFNSNVPPKR